MDQKSYRLRIVISVIGVTFVMMSYYFYQIFFTPNFGNQLVQEQSVLYIRKNAEFKDVLDSLDKYKLIDDKTSFAFIAKLLKYQSSVKPGRYIINKGMTNLQLVRKLRSGQQDAVKLTFNNIRLKEDFAERAGVKFIFGRDSLMKKLNDQAFCKSYGFDTTTILCMFIPNTYELYWDETTAEFFDHFKKEYEKFWNEERKTKLIQTGLTPIQASILASIVEAETTKNDEKSRIAGVYLNRLQIGMPLQADPTVKYALRDFSIKRINQALIEQAGDSPYNTYRVNGLPPGPLNMPSIITLESVLNFEKHNYLFFVVDVNKEGYHKFTSDYRDHVNSANKYRRKLNQDDVH